MKPRRALITAGFSRAPNVHLLLDLFMENDIEVAGLLVVTPFSLKRIRKMVRQRGVSFVWESIPRILGSSSNLGDDSKEDDDLLRELKDRGIGNSSLRTWARKKAIPYCTVSSINSPRAIRFVEKMEFDWIVYGGGGILFDSFIRAGAARILNAHSGLLPFVRGMNACEWSLLLGYPLSVTVHLIDRGVDTGQIILERDVPVYSGETIRQLRSRCTTVGMLAMPEVIKGVSGATTTHEKVDIAQHRQCFPMAQALQEILACGLAKGTFTNTPAQKTKSV